MEDIKLYANLAIGGFAALLVLFALIKGAARGGKRAFARLVIVALGAVGLYLFTQTIVNSLILIDLRNYGVNAIGEIAVTGSIQQTVIDYLKSMETVGDLINASTALQELIVYLPGAICTIIFFVIFFFVYKVLSLIIYGIVKAFIPKYKKEDGEYVRDRRGHKVKLKKSKLAGIAFSLVQAVLIFAIINIPIMGILSNAIVAFDSLKDVESMKETVDQYGGYVDAVSTSEAYTTLEKAKFIELESTLFKKIYKVPENKEKGTQEYYVLEEVLKLLPVAGDALVLSQSLSDPNNMDLSSLSSMIGKIGENELVMSLVSDVASSACSAWANGEEFMGIDLKKTISESLGEEMVGDVLTVLEQFANSDTETFKQDLATIAKVVDIINDAGILSTVSTEGEGGVAGILAALSGEDAEEDGVVAQIFEALSESEHFCSLIPVAMNAGLSAATKSMGVLANKEAVQDKMMDDLAGNVNNAEDQGIVTDNVDSYIEGAAATTKAGGVVDATYLDGTTVKSDYEKYVSLRKNILSSMSKAGLDLGNADHIYETSNHVKYIEVNNVWMLYSDYLNNLSPEDQAKQEAKASSANAVANLLATFVTLGQSNATVDAKAVKAAINTCAQSLDDDVKGELNKLTDKEAFKESSTATTFEDLKFDVANFKKTDVAAIGQIATDLIDVAAAVVSNMGEDGNVNIGSVLNDLPFDKLGSALDTMSTLGGKESIASDLIGVVIENVDLGDESVKDTLKTIQKSMIPDENGKKVDFKALADTLSVVSKFSALLDTTGNVDIKKELTENFTASDWADIFYTLGKEDNTDALEVILESVNGLLEAATKDQEMTGLEDLINTLLGSFKTQKYNSKEDAIADGEVVAKVIKLVIDMTGENGLANVIEGYNEMATDAQVDAVLDYIEDNIDEIFNNEEALLIPTMLTDLLKKVAKIIFTDKQQFLGLSDLTYAELTKDDENNYGTQFVDELGNIFSEMTAEKFGDDLKGLLAIVMSVESLDNSASTISYTQEVTSSESIAVNLTSLFNYGYYVKDNQVVSLASEFYDLAVKAQEYDSTLFADLVTLMNTIKTAVAPNFAGVQVGK